MAQEPNCADPATQYEFTACASIALDAADASLNEAWPKAVALAREQDAADLPEGLPSRANLLRDAQRQWIAYRDAACEAEGAQYYGGTIQNQIFLDCITRLTKDRTRDLRRYADTK